MKDIKTLCDQIRQTAYEIHVYHGQLQRTKAGMASPLFSALSAVK